MKARFLVFLILSIVSAGSAFAQTNELTYQGRLNDDSIPANADYDFRFGLWTAAINGIPLATIERFGVTVTNGSFTVTLDFPAANFTGLDRYLEIAVKPAGGGSYTTLTPRQRITSSPYSIRSLNSTTADTATTATNSNQLGGVAANQFVQTGDPRMTDARNPMPGSTEYIQNNSGFPQTGNFAVTGNGLIGGNALINGTLTVNGSASASFYNANTNYRIGGNRVLSVITPNNTYVGIGSGLSSAGADNSFFGFNAGGSNGLGNDNSFFGSDAGGVNNSGNANCFFGSDTGDSNTFGNNNSFFGRSAGSANETGSGNTFMGFQAGLTNTAGLNSFFGSSAGQANTTGAENAFFGSSSGLGNTIGAGNSFFGFNAGFSNTSGVSNSFFGRGAGNTNSTGTSNSFFGNTAGSLNNGSNNSFFGHDAGENNTSGSGNSFLGLNAGDTNGTGSNNTAIGSNSDVSSGNLSFATAIGAGSVVTTSNTVRLGRSADSVNIPGSMVVSGAGTIQGELSVTGDASFNYLFSSEIRSPIAFIESAVVGLNQGGGSLEVCQATGQPGLLSYCSSSLRYKINVQPFFGGLDVVRRLRPITFNWKNGGLFDVGFAAEEVADIEPLLVTQNDKGKIEGVKYRQISTILVNAVKEQQSHIEAQAALIKGQQGQLKQHRQVSARQQAQIDEQKLQINALKAALCQMNPKLAVCTRSAP